MNLYQNRNLLKALDLYVREQDALLPREEELSSVTLSPAFHEKMQHLLTLRKRGYYVLFGTIARRVASILIAVLLAFTTATVSVKALRERVVAFFTEVFDTHTAVTFVDETPDVEAAVEETFTPLTPTYIPEGYVVEREMSLQSVYRVVYINAEGSRINYLQNYKESGDVRIDTEGTQYEEIKINEYIGVTYCNKNVLTILFSDNEYTYTLSGICTLEELIKIAESIN